MNVSPRHPTRVQWQARDLLAAGHGGVLGKRQSTRSRELARTRVVRGNKYFELAEDYWGPPQEREDVGWSGLRLLKAWMCEPVLESGLRMALP